MRRPRWTLLLALLGGCAEVLGANFDEAHPYDASAQLCEPGTVEACPYLGAPDTEGVGICRAGKRECLADGSGFGGCAGEVTPSIEDATVPADENCDGYTGNHVWSRRYGDSSFQSGAALAATPAGEVYACGYFYGSMDFGGQAFTAQTDKTDAYVAKIDANGNHLWSRAFGSPAIPTTVEVCARVVADADSVVLGGSIGGATDFGGGPLTPLESLDIYVAKFTHEGAHVWSKVFAGEKNQRVYGMALDQAGRITITGSFDGTLEIDELPTLIGAPDEDLYLVQLDASGEARWALFAGGPGRQMGTRLDADANGNVLLYGTFSGDLALGDPPLTGAGVTSFVAKVTPDGEVAWRKTLGATDEYSGGGLAAAPDGGVLVATNLIASVDLGTGPIVTEGGSDVLVARFFSSDGSLVWARRIGDLQPQFVTALDLDPEGNVLIVGHFEQTIDFGLGVHLGAGGLDTFVAKLDGEGATLWSRAFSSRHDELLISVVADEDSHPLFAGRFDGVLSWGGEPLSSAGQSDLVIVKLEP